MTETEPGARTWARVDDYFEVLSPEDEHLRATKAATARAGLPDIAVAPNQGKLLRLLAEMVGARRILELGTLGGYSTLWLARALPSHGTLVTLEIDPAHAEVARASLAAAGVGALVDVVLGPASDTLQRLAADGTEPFDLVFIDADKTGYPAYLDWAAEHLRVGGLVLADNTFGFGHVHDPASAGEDAAGVEALALFADRLANGGRFRATILPTAEGLSLGVKLR
jgi:predicted O-methyltransferase YrrM